MQFPLAHWWTRDTALHSFVFCNFLIGLPFTIFNTYVIYQLQIVGYLIGTDVDDQPCTTYCIVPWAGSRLDLNSVLLYLNAIGFGVGGAVTMFLSAYSDFWPRKHLLVTIFIVAFGAFAIPAYWLQGYSVQNFQTLTALYIIFAIITSILIALLNIYIPHCMRTSVSAARESTGGAGRVEEMQHTELKSSLRRYGFNMTIFGTIAAQVGGVVLLVIVIILSETLNGTAAASAGLLVTTVTGFLTVAGSLVALCGLPPIPSKPSSPTRNWIEPIVEFFRPFRDLFVRRNMAVLLISYTIYTDTIFAVTSVIGQLFVAEIRPGALEYSLYSLAQVLCIIVTNLLFLWIRPKLPISLEKWLISGYAISLLLPIWGCIGFAGVSFGFKMRWEFYVQLFVIQLSSSLANASFRVMFSEMIPVGNEVRWFGLQLTVSCGTIWVNYVASGPLQNATHELRFPLLLALLFLLVSVGMEICRSTLPVFKNDRRKWEAVENFTSQGSDDKYGTDEAVVQKTTVEANVQVGVIVESLIVV